MYLVELDDDNRERVLKAEVENVVIEQNPQYDTMFSSDSTTPLRVYQSSMGITLKADIVPNREGTAFVMENFNEEEDNE